MSIRALMRARRTFRTSQSERESKIGSAVSPTASAKRSGRAATASSLQAKQIAPREEASFSGSGKDLSKRAVQPITAEQPGLPLAHPPSSLNAPKSEADQPSFGAGVHAESITEEDVQSGGAALDIPEGAITFHGAPTPEKTYSGMNADSALDVRRSATESDQHAVTGRTSHIVPNDSLSEQLEIALTESIAGSPREAMTSVGARSMATHVASASSPTILHAPTSGSTPVVPEEISATGEALNHRDEQGKAHVEKEKKSSGPLNLPTGHGVDGFESPVVWKPYRDQKSDDQDLTNNYEAHDRRTQDSIIKSIGLPTQFASLKGSQAGRLWDSASSISRLSVTYEKLKRTTFDSFETSGTLAQKKALTRYAVKERSAENLYFLFSLDKLTQTPAGNGERTEIAKKMQRAFFEKDAPLPPNLTDRNNKGMVTLLNQICLGNTPENLVVVTTAARKNIVQSIREDIYMRFVDSLKKG